MAVDEQDNPSESTPREAELQRQLDGLQSQVTDLHKAREATGNLELSSEVQRLKEKLDEHSKQLEQSAEMLTQLESENLVLSMPSLNTPNTTGCTARHPSGEAGASGEKAGDTRVHETISSDSEKETSEGAASLQSLLTTYLEQMISKKLDAMQSMVERLPGVAPPIRKSNPGS
ncbi:hypothetical protein DY000_02015477 [Brassica cretica]|uniref:Uncharacterized protein n=1 Tax=Brassica cretica TaxID=69181 RepID=A0ABQ7D495_BRACR|nr:hypothetical protein DY000_02015477 [Brassica cretica]